MTATANSHIDLFSGIGGFALAARWAGFETQVFCEKDKFCQGILNKHWPNIPIVEDIFKFEGSKHTGATVLTAGVPCQPASEAGKRRGSTDDNWLWPEAFRVIREVKPKWVILENVRGLISLQQGLELKNLLSEMERADYETRVFNLPACGVDAPHRRERVWIVAHTNGPGGWSEAGDFGDKRRIAGNDRGTSLQEYAGRKESPSKRDIKPASVDGGEVMADPESKPDRRDIERGLETNVAPEDPRGREYAIWPPEPGVGRLLMGFPTGWLN